MKQRIQRNQKIQFSDFTLYLPEQGIRIEVQVHSDKRILSCLQKNKQFNVPQLQKLNFYNLYPLSVVDAFRPLPNILAKYNSTKVFFSKMTKYLIEMHPELQQIPNLIRILKLYLQKKEEVLAIYKQINKKTNEKSKKRCLLHSMKSLNTDCWKEQLLEMISEEKEFCEINVELFNQNLFQYLRKKKFCSQCRENVLNSYEQLKNSQCINDCKCTIFSFLRYSHEQQLILVPYDQLLINTIVHKTDMHIPFYQHASTKEDAQEELLICLGSAIKEQISQEWKQLQSNNLIKNMFLCQVGELILQKIQIQIRQKLQSLGQMNELDVYLMKVQEQKDKLRQRRKLRKQKRKQTNSDNSSQKTYQDESHSPRERNLLASLGWNDTPSVSPQTRKELEVLRNQHFEQINKRRKELREQTKACWCEWCKEQRKENTLIQEI